MTDAELAWNSEESLTNLTLYADWDSVLSMMLSLRAHLFKFGTIPSWNFMFCHGRPELAVPYSWAYTWPSLFVYAMPSMYAVIAIWTLMTAVGFVSTRTFRCSAYITGQLSYPKTSTTAHSS